MVKEPPELIEARNLFKKFEGSIKQRQAELILADFLDCVDGVINGNFAEVFKTRARNMRNTCWSLVSSNVNSVLISEEPLSKREMFFWLDILYHFPEENAKEMRTRIFIKWIDSMDKQEFERFDRG